MADQPDQAPPTAPTLLWLFARWMPAVAMITMLTTWVLVMMGGLARVTGWMFIVFVLPFLGLFIVVVVGIYAGVRRRVSRPMVVTWIAGLFVIWPGLWDKGVLPMAYPSSIDDSPVYVRLPCDEPMRVYWGGAELSTNYHALYPDQRWAYDLVIDPAGHQKPKLESYGCFGKTVVAPTAGKIVIAEDGEMDQPPGVLSASDKAFGNHVALETLSNTYLIIAHLKKGSVAVASDDQVNVGDKLGECGNSGRTSEPHVHIHHQRQDPRSFPLGFAEGLPLFFRDHDGPKMPTGGVERDGDRVKLLGPLIQHAQKPRQN